MSASMVADDVAIRSRSGRPLTIRSARVEDVPAISAMIGGLSPRTVALRYLLPQVRLSPEAARREAERVAGAGRVVYIAVSDEGAEPQIVGIAELSSDGAEPSVAEGAIVIADAFQSDGIGRAIAGQLVAAADRQGFSRVRAVTLAHNGPIRRLIVGLGRPYTARFAGGEIIYEIG